MKGGYASWKYRNSDTGVKGLTLSWLQWKTVQVKSVSFENIWYLEISISSGAFLKPVSPRSLYLGSIRWMDSCLETVALLTTGNESFCGEILHSPKLFQMTSFNQASQVALVVKNLPTNAGDLRDASSIPRWGRFPGEGNGTPLWYSCLENPMDRRARQATVHGVAKCLTGLKQRSI